MSFFKNKIFKYSVILLIAGVSYGYIAFKIIEFKDLFDSTNLSLAFSIQSAMLLVMVLILAFPNWGLEALKWQRLMIPVEKLSYKKSLMGTLTGITASIITPNRIGSIPGKMIVVSKRNYGKSMIAASISSLSQLCTTIIMGVIAYFILTISFPEKYQILGIPHWLFLLLGMVILPLIIILHFQPHFITKLLPWIRFKDHADHFKFLTVTSKNNLAKTLLLSFVRYSIFFIQFFFLLILFRVDVTIKTAFIAIGLQYILMSIIPSFALTELGVRGSLSIVLIGLFSDNIAGIVLASSTLWLVNIAIPGAIGTFGYLRHLKKSPAK